MPTRAFKSRNNLLQRLIITISVVFLPFDTAWSEEAKPRLVDQPPFDRITLKAETGGETIDTSLLDLPDRQVPSPLPTEGELKLRRLVDPTVEYLVPWRAIEKIDTFEQLIFAETNRLIADKDFSEAFVYLEFLFKHYPDIPGLASTHEDYLKQEALYAFTQRKFDDAVSILTALHDLNSKHNGLTAAADTVIDQIVKSHLKAKDFAAARRILDSSQAAFPQLQLKSVPSWKKKFQAAANRQIKSAQNLLSKQKYHEARLALRRAVAILPSTPNVKEMFAEIDRLSPQVVVGVTSHGSSLELNPLANKSALRVSHLLNPKFIDMVDFGSEGGIYTSLWAEFSLDDTGLQFSIQLNKNAIKDTIQPDIIATQILDSASPSNPQHQPTLSGLLDKVSIYNGQEVILHLNHPHVRPEALIQIPVRNLATGNIPPGSYQAVPDKSDRNLLRYDALEKTHDQKLKPSILEKIYTSEEEALTALLTGEVDVIDRVAPWQIDRIRRDRQITISEYRLPTVHVLLPNYSKPLLRRREFRRALCYGIDRQEILSEVILGGSTHPGFRVLSGPLPAGVSISDPLGFGYKQELKPRPYEPRLAAVLATVARASILQNNEAQQLTENANENLESVAEIDPDSPEIEPIVLAFPPDYIARATCQTIKRQLDAIGVPVELLELSPYMPSETADYDICYAELSIWEPLTDMQQILGPSGIAGNCSPAMSLALDALDQARNWQESRNRLRDLHEVAFYDLPVVPLWQTVNSFAFRKSLEGINPSPIALYQDVANWKSSSLGAE